MHLQRFTWATGDVIDAHLDDDDPHVFPIEHAARATHALEYGLWGGVGLGLLAYAFTGDKRAALVVGSLAAGGGVYHGAHTPKQSRKVFLLSEFVAASRLCASTASGHKYPSVVEGHSLKSASRGISNDSVPAIHQD